MRAWLVLLALVLAGCVETSRDSAPVVNIVLTPSGAPVGAASAESFWMVWVHGEERVSFGARDARAVCSLAFDHSVDPSTRTLRLAQPERYDPPNATAYVAFDIFDSSTSCPVAYRVVEGPHANATLGHAGRFTIDVRPDGTLLLEGGTEVPRGQAARVTYDAKDAEGRAVRGEWIVENLGAWARANVTR